MVQTAQMKMKKTLRGIFFTVLEDGAVCSAAGSFDSRGSNIFSKSIYSKLLLLTKVVERFNKGVIESD